MRGFWTKRGLPLAAKTAIAATVTSGIRSIYGYCFNVRVDSWSPFALNPAIIAPFANDALKDLAAAAPFGNGRVTLGVAFDLWFLPQEMLKPMFEGIKKLGIKHFTTHNTPSPPGQYPLCPFHVVSIAPLHLTRGMNTPNANSAN